MARVHYLIAAALAVICLVAFLFSPAWAQDAAPVIAPSSIWYEVWTIVQPVVVLLISIVGPALVTWLSVRLGALLKISDEKQRVEIEAGLRKALHEAALNALKYAAVKSGFPLSIGGVGGQVLDIAADYVREKNPDALAKLGVDNKTLKDIIMSKVPEVAKAVN